jgi:hypothetical protein
MTAPASPSLSPSCRDRPVVYAAARVAGRNGLLHGLLTGLCAAAVGALFLVYTFSWEGTHREAVWFAIGRAGGLAVAAGCIGGLLGDRRNRGDRS